MTDTDFIDKIALIYLQDKKVLSTMSKGKDTWYLPGGKREAGESDAQTLVREIKEELNVDVKLETIKPYGVFEAQAYGKPEGTIVRMTCYTAEFSGVPKTSSEIDKIDFFDNRDDIKKSPVDYLIFDDLYAKGLIS